MPAHGHKKCSRCKTEKLLDCFGIDSKTCDGLRPECRICRNIALKSYRKGKNDFLHRQNYHLQKTYGITFAEKMALLVAQGGKCAICGTTWVGKMGWSTDHNHKTGKVRGILCEPCNTGGGKYYEDPIILRKAADYFENDGPC